MARTVLDGIGARASVAILLASAVLVSCTAPPNEAEAVPHEAGPPLIGPPPPPDIPAGQAALPADGKYLDVTILGESVASIEITDSGRRVLVDVDGKEPISFEQEFRRLGESVGKLDQRRFDTNGDGDFDDELALLGIWRLDVDGSIRK